MFGDLMPWLNVSSLRRRAHLREHDALTWKTGSSRTWLCDLWAVEKQFASP